MEIALAEIELPPEDERCTVQGFWVPWGGKHKAGFNITWSAWPLRPQFPGIVLQALSGDEEVARIWLRPSADFSKHYLAGPKLHHDCLDFQHFEVREDLRRQGVGTRVVQLVREYFAEYKIGAYAHHSDWFWGTLGWPEYLRKGVVGYEMSRLFVAESVEAEQARFWSGVTNIDQS